MKLRITFKDPDGVSECIREAVEDNLPEELTEEEKEELSEKRQAQIDGALEKWIEYSEYLTVEFDTEKGTATVIPIK